jgi:hypothetical protein
MGRRTASVLGAILLGSTALLAACGQDSRSAAPSDTASPSGGATAAGSSCPQPSWLAGLSPGEAPPGYGKAAAPLQADQAAVEEWGRQHAEQFSASWIGFDGTNAQVVVALAGTSVEPSGLQSLVSTPERLAVCQHRHARAELDRIAGQIGPAGSEIRDVHVDAVNDVVSVALAADQADKASRINEQFGNAVRLRVGWLNYPLRAESGAVTTGPCRPLPDPGASGGLSAQLVLGATALGRGGQARGVVHVRNTSAQPIELRSVQPLDAVLLQPGSKKVVGALAASRDNASAGSRLGPGETVSLPVMAGTDSCDPSLGYMVPPGAYDVVVVVPGAGAATSSNGPTVVSNPTQITITS